jgi:hypothetical protein
MKQSVLIVDTNTRTKMELVHVDVQQNSKQTKNPHMRIFCLRTYLNYICPGIDCGLEQAEQVDLCVNNTTRVARPTTM